MTIHVLYFASLREAFATGEERVELPDSVVDVAGLRDWLAAEKGRQMLKTARNLRCAVNQEMAGFEAAIRDGDEIAFFPPVTGG